MYFLKDLYYPRSFKRDRIFAKNIESWRAIAPDFSTLRDIADTLKELELVFMYDNSSNSAMYSSLRQRDGIESFIVDNDRVTILISLELEKDIININLKRKKGSKLESNFRFKNHEGEEYVRTVQDQMLFALIEDTIMTTFCDLLEAYYYNGPHRDINPKFLPTFEG